MQSPAEQTLFDSLSTLEASVVRWFTGLLAIAVMSVLFGVVQAQDIPVAKNVVLVHGLYADGSSWIDVIPYLQRAGLKVTAVQNPLTSLADDVAATRRARALQDGPTVLVGSSPSASSVCRSGARRRHAAKRKDHDCRMESQTCVVPGIDPRPHDQPGAGEISGQAHEGDHHRTRLESCIAGVSPEGNRDDD
jgi:hypothetical protein